MAEEWRPVPGWECEASDQGNIRTLAYGLPYVLRPSRDRKGYKQVSVGNRTVRVHRLVALAWHGPKPPGQQVRHLDSNKENCAPWNLKYGTQTDQERDKRLAGTSRVKRGMLRDESERREKEGNRTGAYRAHGTATTKTNGYITLHEAVRLGIVPCDLWAARKAQQRDPAFPLPVGRYRRAYLFDLEALRAWTPQPRGRRRT